MVGSCGIYGQVLLEGAVAPQGLGNEEAALQIFLLQCVQCSGGYPLCNVSTRVMEYIPVLPLKSDGPHGGGS